MTEQRHHRRPHPPTAGSAEATATRRVVLARAVDLASVEGLDGLSIGRLAADLEISKSGLIAHFGSKEGLQLATIRAARAIFVHTVIEPTLETPPGMGRLRGLLEAWLEYSSDRRFPGGCFFARASHEYAARPGAVRDALAAVDEEWLGLIAESIARRRRRATSSPTSTRTSSPSTSTPTSTPPTCARSSAARTSTSAPSGRPRPARRRSPSPARTLRADADPAGLSRLGVLDARLGLPAGPGRDQAGDQGSDRGDRGTDEEAGLEAALARDRVAAEVGGHRREDDADDGCGDRRTDGAHQGVDAGRRRGLGEGDRAHDQRRHRAVRQADSRADDAHGDEQAPRRAHQDDGGQVAERDDGRAERQGDLRAAQVRSRAPSGEIAIIMNPPGAIHRPICSMSWPSP